ncbi:MAG: hypothetical protein Lm2023SU_03180 [Serratia ureilytica]
MQKVTKNRDLHHAFKQKAGYAGFTKTERQRGKLYDIEHYQQTNGYHSRNPQSRRRPSHQTGKMADPAD